MQLERAGRVALAQGVRRPAPRVRRVRALFRDRPARRRALHDDRLQGTARRRHAEPSPSSNTSGSTPLMSPVTAGATAPFRLLPGFDRALAIAGGVALLAAANLTLCALVLRRLLMDPT